LLVQRFVEAVFGLEPLDHLLGRVGGKQDIQRIAGHHVNEGEDEQRYAEQDRYGVQQAHGNELEHAAASSKSCVRESSSHRPAWAAAAPPRPSEMHEHSS
jgi:hypothetical protein